MELAYKNNNEISVDNVQIESVKNLPTFLVDEMHSIENQNCKALSYVALKQNNTTVLKPFSFVKTS